jgi:DNA-binding beta-propeller fold protein YncE
MIISIGSPGPGLNQFNIPYGITLDSNSNIIYIADCNNNRVMKYTSGALSGTLVADGNSSGTNNTQLNCPAGLYFDSLTNSLTIANFFECNIVRWVLSNNQATIIAGDPNGLNGNTSTLLDHPTNIIFDPMGNMYIADMYNHRIQMYLFDQSNGTTIAGISGKIGNNSTMLYYPVSLTLDNQLNLYVTDSYNQRIQQFLRY